MIFVDTSGWYASVVAGDPNHRAAAKWLAQNTDPLFTTDYVIDETLTLLRVRGMPLRAQALGAQFFLDHRCIIHFVTEPEVREAWNVFSRYGDKEWSFTDCVCRVVMARMGITTAFAFDRHFTQFGGVQVMPDLVSSR